MLQLLGFRSITAPILISLSGIHKECSKENTDMQKRAIARAHTCVHIRLKENQGYLYLICAKPSMSFTPRRMMSHAKNVLRTILVCAAHVTLKFFHLLTHLLTNLFHSRHCNSFLLHTHRQPVRAATSSTKTCHGCLKRPNDTLITQTSANNHIPCKLYLNKRTRRRVWPGMGQLQYSD